LYHLRGRVYCCTLLIILFIIPIGGFSATILNPNAGGKADLPVTSDYTPQYTWGISVGDNYVYFNLSAYYAKFTVTKFNSSLVHGMYGEVAWTNYSVWEGSWTYDGEQPMGYANLTWGADFLYPVACALPLIGSNVNLTAVNQSFYTQYGVDPATVTSYISGQTLTILNNTGLFNVVLNVTYLAGGVLQSMSMEDWQGHLTANLTLAAGPNYPILPENSIYHWGVHAGDTFVWQTIYPTDLNAYWTAVKYQVEGFVTGQFGSYAGEGLYVKAWENLTYDPNHQWDPSIICPFVGFVPPELPQPLSTVNWTWQSVSSQVGYPAYWMSYYANYEMYYYPSIIPLDMDGAINWSWYNQSLCSMGSGLPPELAPSISGNTYTLTNTTSGWLYFTATYDPSGVLLSQQVYYPNNGSIGFNYTLVNGLPGSSKGNSNYSPNPSNPPNNPNADILGVLENPLTWIGISVAVVVVTLGSFSIRKRHLNQRNALR